MNSKKLINYEGINKPDSIDDARQVLAVHYNNLYEDVETIETNLARGEQLLYSCQSHLDTLEAAVLVESISEAATTVLTAADSGKTFFVDAVTTAANFTLPTPVAGLKYKFIWVADCDNAVTITTADTTDTTGDMLRGGLLVCAAAAVNTFVEASGNVCKATFDDNVENGAAGIGSWVEVICAEDAVWYITGVINSTSDADGVGSSIFSDVD